MSTTAAKRLAAIERFATATKAEIRHRGVRAFYGAYTDSIQMPDRDRFIGSAISTPTESYYSMAASGICL